VIVALTGWGQDQDRERAEEAGFDRHVVKPIGEEELRTLCGGAAASS
jgi:CheY-like chemotaxis protein